MEVGECPLQKIKPNLTLKKISTPPPSPRLLPRILAIHSNRKGELTIPSSESSLYVCNVYVYVCLYVCICRVCVSVCMHVCPHTHTHIHFPHTHKRHKWQAKLTCLCSLWENRTNTNHLGSILHFPQIEEHFKFVHKFNFSRKRFTVLLIPSILSFTIIPLIIIQEKVPHALFPHWI